MLLTPRYGTDPAITLDGSPGAIAAPSIRQRERLLDVLATLTDDQWDAPSRCEGWTVRDCMVHLESTNGFWEASIRGGLAGTPTEFLASFDPAATPAAMVAASAASPGEVLDTMRTSATSLNGLLESLTDTDWETLAEAPPGHISISAVAHHALWDSWIHERDVCLPLGIEVVEEPDEVEACLRYASALSLSFLFMSGVDTDVRFSVDVTEPSVSFDVHVDVDERVAVSAGATCELVAGGDAVELLEAVSCRRPFGSEVPEAIQSSFDGLGRVFDQIVD